MTKLEMQIALQPLYKKMMGDKKTGDRVYDADIKQEGIIISTLGYITVTYGEVLRIEYKICWDSLIILPLPIDPVNPERGLWGMVDWRKFERKEISGNGKLWMRPVNEKHGWDCDPEEALLKALLEQEGYESWTCVG